MATISKATVISITPYGDGVREYILKLDKYHFFDPGTFLQLTLDTPKNNRWPESRNFSIASFMNNDGTIRLVIRKVGTYTTRIFNELNLGGECFVKYSFGDFLLPFFDKTNPIVCIAGGTGIAPFLSFVEYMAKENDINRLSLFYSAKNKQELICPEVITQSIYHQNLTLNLTRENDPNYGFGRLNIDSVLGKIDNIADAHFYICGGEDFTTKFKNQLFAKGAKNIYTDEW